jgi:tetratricopeptide (TPR) repeat protein
VGLRAAVARLLPAAGREGQRDEEAWGALALACGAAVFLNPHGLNLIGHTSGTLFFKSRELIGEWAPFSKPLGVDGAFFAAGAAAIAYGWSEEPLLAACAAVFGLMALSAVRNIFLYQLTSAALIARVARRRRPIPESWAGTAAVAVAGAVLALCAFCAWRFAEFMPRHPGAIVKQPEQAVRFLDENDVDGRMFHAYELGGYLIGRCYPRRKVFVDGRNVEYGPEFISKVIRWYRPGVFESLDAEWAFDYAVLLNGQDYKARELDESPRWALVFWDDAGLVYLKREPRNEALIKRFGYSLLRPNRPEFTYLLPLLADKRTSAKVLAEIERSVSASPENVNAREMKAFALDALSRPNDALAELKRAVEAFPDKPGPYMSLGWWYERRGRLPEARESYAAGAWAARRQRDEMSEAYLDNNLAMVEARLGNPAEARRLLRRCLRVWPLHPRAAANLSRLESQGY